MGCTSLCTFKNVKAEKQELKKQEAEKQELKKQKRKTRIKEAGREKQELAIVQLKKIFQHHLIYR